MSAQSRSVRSLLAAFLAVLSLVIAAVPVGAQSGAAYRADITSGTGVAGTTSTLVITLRQLTNTLDQRVRSARVTAPDGSTITSASARKGNNDLEVSPTPSTTVTVDDIPALTNNQTAVITLQVAIDCGSVGDTWGVVAKNVDTFESGGSALAKAGDSQLTTSIKKCSLAWVEQPESAQRGAVITGVEADPTSNDRVKVRVRNGNGGEAHQSGITVDIAIVPGTGASGAILGGDISDATNANGVAVFEPTINQSERGYKLEATATDIKKSDASDPFEINDVAKVCQGAGCNGSSQKGTTTASISANSSGVLTMSLDLDRFDCDNAANQHYKSKSVPVTWNVTNANGRTVMVIRLAAADVERPYNLYDVCFSADSYGFRNRYNVRIDPGEAGLLKICPPRLDKQNADPCVEEKWRENGDVLIRFSVPPGDPRGRI